MRALGRSKLKARIIQEGKKTQARLFRGYVFPLGLKVFIFPPIAGGLGIPPAPFWTSSLNTTNEGRIKRGIVAMGCVVDVVRGYYPVLNEDIQKGGRGHS